MSSDLNLFDGRKGVTKGSTLLLFLSIISALLIGGISGCSCGEDVVDGTEIDGGTRDVVGVGDAVSDVEELSDIVVEDTTGDIGLDAGVEDIINAGDGGEFWDYFPKTYGGSGNDYALSIKQTTDGGYIVAGYTQSFGAGDWDFWVLKLNSDGSVDGICPSGIGATTNATIKETSATTTDTTATANSTSAAASSTSVTGQDTNVTINMQCTAP